ncbi:MAG: hypothetical protein U0169_14840 [Polyangiaceae bacterium]
MRKLRGTVHSLVLGSTLLAACGGHVDPAPTPETLVDLRSCGSMPTDGATRALVSLDPSGAAFRVGAIDVDAEDVVFLAEGDAPEKSEILSVSRSGGTPKRLAAAPFATRAVALGEYVYFTDAGDGGLHRVRRAGDTPAARFAPPGSEGWQSATPLALTKVGDAVYFAFVSGAPKDMKTGLARIEAATGTLAWVKTFDGIAAELVVDGNDLFFVRGSNELARATIGEGATLATSSVVVDAAGIGGVDVEGGVVFYAAGSSILARTDSGTPVTIATGQDHPTRLVVDGAHVTWMNAGHLEGTCGVGALSGDSLPCHVVGSGLYRAAKAGGAIETLSGAAPAGPGTAVVLASGRSAAPSDVRDFAADGCALYWSSDGRVLSRSK